MTCSRLEPFFLEGTAGRLFCLLRAPADAQRAVLVVPPFAEEMNKSRRQLAITAEALTASGFAVLQPDLFGTGDSDGDFVDANWDVWLADLKQTIAWAEATGFKVDAVLAVRLGCILAAEVLHESDASILRSVFLQPVDNGSRFMNQFLRLRIAASMMNDVRETAEELSARLGRGESLEVAGYPLSPELWRSIRERQLPDLLGSGLGQLAIFEVGRSNDNRLSVAGQRIAASASAAGLAASGMRVAGEPFWSATEIVTNAELVEHTVASLRGEVAWPKNEPS